MVSSNNAEADVDTDTDAGLGRAMGKFSAFRKLAELAETAGAAVMGKVLQKRMKPEPATFIGTGKALTP